MPPALRNLYGWDGVGYGVLNDADGQVCTTGATCWPIRRTRPPSRRLSATTCRHRPDLAAGPRHRALLQRQELGCSRQPPGQRHGPASETRRAGVLPFPVIVGCLRRGAGPDIDRYHNVYWFDPQDTEAADQRGRACRGTGAAAGTQCDRPSRPDRLAAAAGLGVLPARQGGDDVHLGRSRRPVPGRDRSLVRQLRGGDAAGLHALLGPRAEQVGGAG